MHPFVIGLTGGKGWDDVGYRQGYKRGQCGLVLGLIICIYTRGAKVYIGAESV